LGFLAGEMLLTDPAMEGWFGKMGEQTVVFAGIIGAGLVVALGLWLQKRSKRAAQPG
jgi:LPXTG-motif cell wall-anchored protein